MKWYFLFRIPAFDMLAAIRYYGNAPFYDLIRCFQYSARVTTIQVTVKTYCPSICSFFFSTIKTRNSTLKFLFLFFWPHAPALSALVAPSRGLSAHRNLNYYHACKCVGVVFCFFFPYFVYKKGSRGVIPFRLSKTNQADHMCLGAPSFWSVHCTRIMLHYNMIYPRGLCPFFTPSASQYTIVSYNIICNIMLCIRACTYRLAFIQSVCQNSIVVIINFDLAYLYYIILRTEYRDDQIITLIYRYRCHLFIFTVPI